MTFISIVVSKKYQSTRINYKLMSINFLYPLYHIRIKNERQYEYEWHQISARC